MKFLAVALGLLTCLVAGCGGEGGSDSPSSQPDLTGAWVGTFTPDAGGAPQIIYLVIADQNKKNFAGTWEDGTLMPQGQVSGSIYPGNNSRWITDWEMTQGDDVTCCVPLLGCYVWPFRQISMSGYYESESIVDEAASYNYGCFITDGTMSLTRQ